MKLSLFSRTSEVHQPGKQSSGSTESFQGAMIRQRCWGLADHTRKRSGHEDLSVPNKHLHP